MITIGQKYTPIIKAKGFCPNPIARDGIPEFADSAINPDLKYTVAYEDFWNEQIDRCVNGYDTGGLHITGRHYWYMNFCKIATLKRGEHLPEFVDLDHEFFTLVDFVKGEGKFRNDPSAGGKGIISLKRRRAGVSYKFAHGIFGYGLRFNASNYKAGVVAGQSDYSEDFYMKMKECNARMIPEFQLNALADNMNEWKAGYEVNLNNKFIKDGSFNTIFCATAKANENVFKGKALDDCGFEEGGEFKNIKKCYGATKACFMGPGGKMLGTPFVWGTGGNIKSSSKEFKEMLYEAEHYGLVPFDIMGDRIQVGFFIGSINENGEPEEKCPNLEKEFEGYDRDRLLGCEDTQAVVEHIKAKRAALSKAEDKQAYYDYFQDNPLNRKEAFLNFSGNPYDPEIIAAQLDRIQQEYGRRYQLVKLEWKVNKEGERIVPFEIDIVPAKPHETESDCWMMLEPPAPSTGNYCAGGDGYEIDQSFTSKSLGAFAVMRRRDLKTGNSAKVPVLLYRGRPKRKEIFHDECLKAATLYNTLSATLFDVGSSSVIKHFKDNGGTKFLAKRPKAFSSVNSEQNHEYGYKFTSAAGVEREIVSLNQSWILDHAKDCWFPHILVEYNEYDVKSVDSDWDAADAWTLALIQDVVMRRPATDISSKPKTDDLMPVWLDTGNGTMNVAASFDFEKPVAAISAGQAPHQDPWW